MFTRSSIVSALALLPVLLSGCAQDSQKLTPAFTLSTTPSAVTVAVGEPSAAVTLVSEVDYRGGEWEEKLTFASSNPAIATVTALAPVNGGFSGYGFSGGGSFHPSTRDEAKLTVACHEVGVARIEIEGELDIVEHSSFGSARQSLSAKTSFKVTCIAKTGMGCTEPGTAAVAALGTALGSDSSALCAAIDMNVSDEDTVHSSTEVASVPGAGDHTESLARLATRVTLDADRIASEPMLACGEHEGSTTHCVNAAAAMEPGEYVLVANVLHAAPPAAPETFLTYGLVFDSDGDAANDFQADPAYPNDWYQGTDRWYELAFAPGGTWCATAEQIIGGIPTALLTSSARVIVVDNVVALLAPASEFAASSPRHRVTAFSHPGDWGFGGVWSGDVEPPVADGLAAFAAQ